MPRKPRVEFAGAVYHVMNRGDRGGPICRDRLDYDLFVAAMNDVCGRTGWRWHSYVLMPNHFHWLVETPEPNLVAGMKWFMGAYSQGFNARHGQRGHVFQGRYKAVLIEPEGGGHFETVSTYIHLNPARAGLLNRENPELAGYRWSSYPQYLMQKTQRPAWLVVHQVLGNLDLEDTRRGRQAYAQYLRGRIRELSTRAGRQMYKELWAPIRYGWCVGGEAFREKMLERVGRQLAGRQRESYSGEAKRQHDEREAERLVREGLKTLELTESEIARQPKGSVAKCALAWHVHRHALVSNRWLAARLGMGCSANLSLYINRIRTASDREVLAFRRRLEKS